MKYTNPVLFLTGILFVVLFISMIYGIGKVHEGLETESSSDTPSETTKPTEPANITIPTIAPLPCPDPNVSRINNVINMLTTTNLSNAYTNLEIIDKYLFNCRDNKQYLKEQLKKLEPEVIMNLGALIKNVKDFLNKIDGVLPTDSSM